MQSAEAHQPNDNDLISVVSDAAPTAAALQAKIVSARQQLEDRLGYPVEVDHLEPLEKEGTHVLRVFWRRAPSQ
jgi:hypothetical protein